VLGTGLFQFVPIGACSRVPIIRGAQGGFHMWGSVRARYLSPDNLAVKLSVFDASGSLVPYPANIPNPFTTRTTLGPIDPGTPTVVAAQDAAEG
jgi:hypothetical protein